MTLPGDETLIVRADASPQIGMGHVVRCLALGQAWVDAAGRVEFITAGMPPFLLSHLAQEGFHVNLLRGPYSRTADLEQTRGVADRHEGSWIVVDGYHFDPEYHRALAVDHPILVVDDTAHLRCYDVDAILNSGLHAHGLRYLTRPETRLMFGPRHVPLRRDFAMGGGRSRPISEVVDRIFVTLGGGRVGDLARCVLEGISRVHRRPLTVVFVVSPYATDQEVLAASVEGDSITMELVRDPLDVRGLMAEADLAVSGGGSTLWELSFMGVPSLAIIRSENQRLIVESLHRRGALQGLGGADQLTTKMVAAAVSSLIDDVARRRSMSESGLRLVDALGARRSVETLISLSRCVQRRA